MGFIVWIVLGLIAGALAKFIMPGRDPGGIIVTILIGIAGALIGDFSARSWATAPWTASISAASSLPSSARSSC
jgi:uncharacterized membrane protein YeaQ/YmgE (transglycosylase-associated protein family)